MTDPPPWYRDRGFVVRLIEELNRARRSETPRTDLDRVREDDVERDFDRPSTRLVVYGTLAPGRPNAWVLDGVLGTWSEGTVRGRVDRKGRYPVFAWDEDAEAIEVLVFTSEFLPEAWPRLDAFEGRGYRRILVPVGETGALRVCNVYEGADPRANPGGGREEGGEA